jgi:undecaprenyl-diphosphatase
MLTLVLVGLAVLSAARGAGARADEPAPVDDLGAGHAIVLGLVEGITEFLPVSSTGHLVVSERLMNLGGEKGSEARAALDSYTIIIQFGAILAILVISRQRVAAVVQGLFGRHVAGRRLLFNLMAAFGPAAVLGLAFGDTIDEHLLEPAPVAAALLLGGIAILVLTPWLRRRRDAVGGTRGLLDDLTVRSALVIGVVQALALWPGTSRSLVTILGGLAVGLSIAAAVEFSFLLGLVTLTAATALSAMKDGGTIVDNYGVATPALGMLAAGVSAFVAVRSFVNYLNRKDLTVFGWYRIVAGVALVVLMATTTTL